MHLTAAGQHLIVLNDLKSASDLLDRKSAVTSHRPRNLVVGIMTGNLLITFLNPGDVYFRTSPCFPHHTCANQRPDGTACAALRMTASAPA